MARDLHANVITALETGTVRPGIFVKMEFDSGDVNVWSGIGEKTIDGDTYSGLGNLGGFSPVTESTVINPYQLDLTLSGIPSAYVALALAEPYKGKPITITMALMDSSGAVIGDTFPMFFGTMDNMMLNIGPEQSNLTLRAEHVFKELEREGSRTFSANSHQTIYPSDVYFDFHNQLQKEELIFGPAPGFDPAKDYRRTRGYGLLGRLNAK